MPPVKRPIDQNPSSTLVGALVLGIAAAVALFAGISASPGDTTSPVLARVGTFERARLVELCRQFGADRRTLDELARGGTLLDVSLIAEVAAAEQVVAIAELPAALPGSPRTPDVERVDVTEALAERLARGEPR